MNWKSFLTVAILAGGLVGCTSMNGAYEYGAFNDLDVDRSGYLDNGEYVNYAWGQADWDNDGFLEDTEWAKYTERYYDPYDVSYDSFTAYDTDGDGLIDSTEFNEVPTTNLFSAWDYDDDDLISGGDWDRATAFYDDNL